QASRSAIGAPEAVAVGPAGAEGKPAIEHDQIIPAGLPTERSPQVDVVKVDQVEAGTVPRPEADEKVGRVQIFMDNARIMEPRHEFAQCCGQERAQARLSLEVKPG